jgi:hypothetical protein
MKLYKVLDAKGRPCHGGRGTWPLPKKGKPGAWLEVKGEIIPCARGLHLCRLSDLQTWLGARIFEAEMDGEKVVCGDKIVVSRARLLRELSWTPEKAIEFACWCAERALKRERKVGREPDQRSWQAIFEARRYLKGEASLEGVRRAANAAAGAAYAAANAAANAAAGAATNAAYAAANAANAAAGAAYAATNAAYAAANAANAAANAANAAYAANAAERRAQNRRLKALLEV